MPNISYYINISVELCGVVVCFLGIMAVLIGTRMDKRTKRYFVFLFLCHSLDLFANLAGMVLEGRGGVLFHALLKGVNFAEYFFGYLLSFIFVLFLLYRVDGEEKRLARGEKRFWYALTIAVLAISVGMLAISQVNGMFYSVTEENIYQRGALFWLSQVAGAISLLPAAVIILRHRKKLRRKELPSFLTYIGLALTALVLQVFIYGYYILLYAVTIASVIMFLIISADQAERYSEKEQENSDMRAALMMSQIQPHFLYNALTSIAQLCEKAPSEAKHATIVFSDYLRGNMNSLKKRDPVPFETELAHLEAYLYLEKMRFGDALEVVYEIETKAFMLPALSLQPLVENAVKHGVGMAENGGTVTVSSREYDDRFEVSVLDDGVGFDVMALPHDDKEHLGIINVNHRLDVMCGASLRIESEVGKGTRATIILPKKK